MDFARGKHTASEAALLDVALDADREPPAWLNEAGTVCTVGFGDFPLPTSGSVRDALAGLAPGPAAITYLAGLDLASLDPGARVAVLQAWEAQAAWVTATTQPVLAAV